MVGRTGAPTAKWLFLLGRLFVIGSIGFATINALYWMAVRLDSLVHAGTCSTKGQIRWLTFTPDSTGYVACYYTDRVEMIVWANAPESLSKHLEAGWFPARGLSIGKAGSWVEL